MPKNPEAIGISFVLTATAEELPEGDDRPCAYCNPDELVAEREHSARMNRTMDKRNKPLPADAGLVKADFLLRFGHENGAGVEVPVCDMCLDGCPVEHDGQTARTEMDYEYSGNGTISEPVVEDDPDTGRTIHRRVPVNGSQ